jgi:serine/threonine protein kinase
MKSIFEGLRYLHKEKNIIHRDLKPRNIIMMNPSKDISDLRIIDFGIACEDVRDQLYHEGRLGTMVY